MMLEPVWSGTALAGFLQLPGHGGNVRHHHLVHKATETQPAKQKRILSNRVSPVIGYQVRHGQRKTFAEAMPLYIATMSMFCIKQGKKIKFYDFLFFYKN